MLSGTLLLNTISPQFSHDGSKRQISGLPPSEGGFIDSKNIQKKGNSTNIIAIKIAVVPRKRDNRFSNDTITLSPLVETSSRLKLRKLK